MPPKPRVPDARRRRPAEPWAELLQRLGERVRAARLARGRTLAQFADAAGLSRRFLTDVELGRANVSLQALAGIAAALELDVAALLAANGSARAGARARLIELAHRLPESALADAADRLERLAAAAPAARRFALVGLRGAGKTTLGKRAAERLKLHFVELDQRIEAAAGMPLSDLFTLHGENHYRQLERDELQALLRDPRPLLVAAGGGIVQAPDTYDLLRRHFVTIWLKASPEDHWNRVVEQGDQRPMQGQPRAMARLREILAERAPLYGLADHAIDTSALGPAAGAAALESIVRAAAGRGGAR